MKEDAINFDKPTKIIIKISEYISIFSKGLILILMIIMSTSVAINVFARYLMGFSIGWSYELAIHSYMYMVYVGTALAIRDRAHPKMEVLLNKSSGLKKKLLIIFNYLVLLFIFYIFTYHGIIEVINRWGTTARMFNYSLGVIYFAIPFCGITSIIYIFEIFLKARKNIELIEGGSEECLS